MFLGYGQQVLPEYEINLPEGLIVRQEVVIVIFVPLSLLYHRKVYKLVHKIELKFLYTFSAMEFPFQFPLNLKIVIFHNSIVYRRFGQGR